MNNAIKFFIKLMLAIAAGLLIDYQLFIGASTLAGIGVYLCGLFAGMI